LPPPLHARSDVRRALAVAHDSLDAPLQLDGLHHAVAGHCARAHADARALRQQCVTKHPTAGCDSTRTCSHHATTIPSCSFSASSCFVAPAPVRAHRYGRPAASRPRLISSSCRVLIGTKLPKDTYTTERAALPPSAAVASSSREGRDTTSSGTAGPTATTSSSGTARRASGSSASNVFTSTLGRCSSRSMNKSRNAWSAPCSGCSGEVADTMDGSASAVSAGSPGSSTLPPAAQAAVRALPWPPMKHRW
ncbi:hypothetical protein EJB05_44803, partial [Eragrostis curvula]